MNISLYTESFKPYLSGVTVSVDTFAKGLTAFGHQVTVFAPEYPNFIDQDKYKVFRFPSLGIKAYPGFRLALPLAKAHEEYHKTWHPDIIHSHSPYQLGLLSLGYAHRHKIPFVYHFHTLFTEYLHFVPLPRAISEPIVKFIVKRFCDRCDLVITPTDIVKNILEKEYKVKARIEVLPTGVDEEAVAKADPAGIREKYGVKPEEFLLEYCGRLSKEKNIEFLLRTFQKVIQAAPQTKLMIVAFGPHEAFLKNLARDLDIADKVIFTGRVEREQVYNYLKAGDLFVCASKTETQGLVLSEAKACGKPAVAISAQGVSRMITDGVDGYLTRDDEPEFVSSVLELIKDRNKLSQFSQNALRIASEKYLNRAITKNLESLYNSVRKA